jgi:oligopeptide/dipeptide ABC transporter ATP-binding protein
MDSERLRDYWGAQIAMVFQDPMTALNPVMKIGRQVTEHMIHHMKVDPDNAKQIALKLLTDVGIPEPGKRFDDYPHQMSGGMRQRIMIAISLACGPSLLLADEPTTALDVTVQAQILRLLAVQRAERNMSMILVTHDLGVVASNTDRVAVMYGGRIMETANTASLFANMRHPYTKALFDSIPNLKNPSHTELTVIPGRPPDLVNPPPGCKFAARCDYATDQCRSEEPILETDGDSEHSFACWHPVGIRGKAGATHA